MSLATVYGPRRFGLSFELFPPKSAAGEAALYTHVGHLMSFRPDFVTCTYGAGGSTRDKTLEIIEQVKQRFGVKIASHLTCVGSTVSQLQEYLDEAQRRGVDHIVALRGDPPQGQAEFRPISGGLTYANELVTLVRREFPSFGIAVAGYPETHREAPNADADLLHLKQKVDCGADVVITQLFYQNADFFRFVERCRQMGIRQPIVPGILPVTNLAQIQRITALCGAKLPADFVAKLGEKDDEDWQFEVGVGFAIRQVEELVAGGVAGLHFYVLNKSQATSRILQAVSVPGR